ncbi:MAG: GtrA family protein, partial [Xanthobacteraceae bacterium]
FVFAASGKPWVSEFGRFAVVNLASFTLVWIISVGLAKIIFPQVGFDWHPEDIAHIIGVLSPIALSYYAHKHFSFKAPGASAGIGNRT